VRNSEFERFAKVQYVNSCSTHLAEVLSARRDLAFDEREVESCRRLLANAIAPSFVSHHTRTFRSQKKSHAKQAEWPQLGK
jgi:hypothetical protein